MADAGHVVISARAEVGLALAARLDVAQVHAQGTANRIDAPRSRMGVSSGVSRHDDGMVLRHREPDREDRRSAECVC